MSERRNVPEIVIGAYELLRRSQTRIDLLFTMSEIPHARPVGRDVRSDVFADGVFKGQFVDLQFHLVEPDGIEPTTSCLQSTRSPS
jgi:hypothetical protein